MFSFNIVLAAFISHKVLTFKVKVHIIVTSWGFHSCKSQIVNNHLLLLTIHFEFNVSSLVTGMRPFLSLQWADPSQNCNSSHSQSSAPVTWLGNKTRGSTKQLSRKAGRNVTKNVWEPREVGRSDSWWDGLEQTLRQDGVTADDSTPSCGVFTSCANG